MNSKRKGDNGERELVGVLRAHGYDAHRNRQWDSSGRENPDVSLPGVHIECKRTERLQLWEALGQARIDANGKALPVVMHRRNHSRWIVVMDLDSWMELYREWEAGQSFGEEVQ